MMLFTKLLLAHLLGDFVLQPDRWMIHQASRKLRSPYFYLHLGLHFLLAFILLWDLDLWWVALVVAGSHGLIEALRLYAQPYFTLERIPFFLGQFLHLAVLAVLVIVLGRSASGQFDLSIWEPNWYLLAAIVFVSHPTATIMSRLLEGMAVQIPVDHKSLPRAGKYIGILERLFVLTFIILGQWGAIGLLITAKSVFRFNDLKESNNRKLTEYILIGTLLSFGLAMLTGLGYLYLSNL